MLRFVAALGLWLLPFFASAHEVYVLTPDEIAYGIDTAHFSLFHTIAANFDQFAFWALIAVMVVVVVFFISTSRYVENALDPLLARLPRYAPLVGRVTVALALFAGAYYQALFGPELPLTLTFGSAAPLVSVLLLVAGFMFLIGYYTRVAALLMLFVYGYATVVHGAYMLTYVNYLGEFALLAILGAHVAAVHHREHDNARAPRAFKKLKEALAPLAFPLLRVAFGVALIYASVYAKILHNELALQVASLPLAGHATSLAMVLGFEPHFLVLGAAIIEITIGLFFMFGIEIRFTSLFLLFWLSLSLWYFGEVVWPHLILIGIPISFIFYGYDKYSLEGYFFKRNGREPVL